MLEVALKTNNSFKINLWIKNPMLNGMCFCHMQYTCDCICNGNFVLLSVLFEIFEIYCWAYISAKGYAFFCIL